MSYFLNCSGEVKKLKCKTRREKKKLKYSASNPMKDFFFARYFKIMVKFNTFKQSGFSVI